MRRIVFVVAALLLAGVAVPAWSQDNWPTKPVKIVVPSSPGGGTDTFARLLAQALSDSMKRQFVVENKPGASGNIGAQAVAQADPDGYTFLVASNSSTAINPWLHKNMPFDVAKDLTPVARGVAAITALVVHPSLNLQNLAEFVAQAKKKPEALAYGSAGTGSSPFLGVRMIEELEGLKFVHAPYKGVGPAYQDLIAGRLQFMYTDLASVLPYVKSGKVKLLATDRKTPLAPGVPTYAEAGWVKFDSPIAFSVLAPAGTPEPILNKMATEVDKALKSIAPKLEQLALVPVYDTPAQFAASLSKERAMWGDFIKRQGITLDQ